MGAAAKPILLPPKVCNVLAIQHSLCELCADLECSFVVKKRIKA